MKIITEGGHALSMEELAKALAPLLNGHTTDVTVTAFTPSGAPREITRADLEPLFAAKTKGEVIDKVKSLLAPFGIPVRA